MVFKIFFYIEALSDRILMVFKITPTIDKRVLRVKLSKRRCRKKGVGKCKC